MSIQRTYSMNHDLVNGISEIIYRGRIIGTVRYGDTDTIVATAADGEHVTATYDLDAAIDRLIDYSHQR